MNKGNRILILSLIVLAQSLYLSTDRSLGATPDLIVYSATAENGQYKIFVMDSDGKNPKQLTAGNFDDYSPIWSPDGSRIAFTRDLPSFLSREVFIMNADGSNQINLTNRDGLDAWPSWSADNSKIIFTSDRDGNREIYRIDLGTMVSTRLTTTETIGENKPQYSPDGSKISYLSGVGDIYVSDSEGRNTKRLTFSGIQKNGCFPWSPDGTKIAFNEVGPGGTFANIFLINVDGTNLKQITNNSAAAAYIECPDSFSPDGSKLLYSSFRAGRSYLYIMNLDGTSVVRLTQDSNEAGGNLFSIQDFPV